MVSKKSITEFLSGKKIAIAGVSRNSKKFGYVIFRTLKEKGLNVYPVNPNAEEILGEKCFKNVSSLPEDVKTLVINTQPEQTKIIVKEAIDKGINNIWIQQGAESMDVLNYVKDKGINVIHNECIFMFTEPVAFPHKMHRFFKKIFGKYPK